MKKLAKVYDAKQVAEGKGKWTQFYYDALGREYYRAFSDGTSETKAYSYGSLARATNRWNQGQLFYYDARGRETWAPHEGDVAPAIARCWDDANRLTAIANLATANALAYQTYLGYTRDAAGQVLSEWQDFSGAGAGTGRNVAYRRYPDGAVAHVDYPNGVRIRRSYNARGQLTQVFQADGAFNAFFELVSYGYNPDGKLSWQTHGNWMATGYAYEADRGRLSISHHYKRDDGAGHPYRNVGWRSYARDDVGRIVYFQKSADGGPAPSNALENGQGDFFGYDAEGQLAAVQYEGHMTANGFAGVLRSQRFVYDQMGGRTQTTNVPAGVGPRPWVVRDNGLNQQWVAHYWSWLYYDNNSDPINGTTKGSGCITAFNGVNYAYNALNQLTAADNYGATPYTFAYDPMGRLVRRTVNGVATFFSWDGWNLIQEGPSSAAANKIYVHGARVDEILARFDYGLWTWHFPHYDARGHCTHLTDRDGNLAEQYAYDAFGRPYVYDAQGNPRSQSLYDNRFLFTGQEWLKNLQIYDYRHRHYHPELGRFLQPDPKHFEAGAYNLVRLMMAKAGGADALRLSFQRAAPRPSSPGPARFPSPAPWAAPV